MNKKLISVLMVVVMLVAVLSTTVCASGTTTPEKFAKATNITGTDVSVGTTPVATISGNETNNVVVTFDSASLKYVAGNTAIGRPEGNSWLGVRMTPPTMDKTINAFDNHTGKGIRDLTDGPSNDSWDMWVAVNEDALTKAAKEGKTSLTYTYIFDWYHKAEEEGSQELVQTQKLTIVINLAGVKLVDEEEKEVWNKWIYNEVKAEAPSKDEDKKPADKDNTSDKDEEPKTGITATAIVATATVAMISLAGVAISKK